MSRSYFWFLMLSILWFIISAVLRAAMILHQFGLFWFIRSVFVSE
ncbi:hypothetical protein [Neorhizobium turbinariae]|nr:hypothetical protein [Neorhizobium turbinariae]